MTEWASRLPAPSRSRAGTTSRAVAQTRRTRDATSSGTRPCATFWVTSASISSIRASRSALVGTGGSSICGASSGSRRPVSAPSRSLKKGTTRLSADVQAAAGDPLVTLLDALEVLLRLRDLRLQDADRGGHRVQRLHLERVDRVHGLVDVRERGLQLGQPDGRRRGLLLDLHRVVAEHLAGALDQVRRRLVEGSDLVEHQLLV